MLWLQNKHGPDGVCEDKERKSSVRAQLSILRQLVDTFIQEEEAIDEELMDELDQVMSCQQLHRLPLRFDWSVQLTDSACRIQTTSWVATQTKPRQTERSFTALRRHLI